MARGTLAVATPPLTAGERRREINARNRARALGWELHNFPTARGRRWVLVSIPRGDEPFMQVERVHGGELIFSLDALEDEIREL